MLKVIMRNNGNLVQKSPKCFKNLFSFDFFLLSLAYVKKKLYLCNVKGKKERNITMKAVVYKTEEERLEALRKMVGMRKIFEARAREIYEQKYGISVAQ